MKGSEFLKKLKRLALSREPGMGKGSQGRVWLAQTFTTLKDPKKELGPGLLRGMCRDLGIESNDLSL